MQKCGDSSGFRGIQRKAEIMIRNETLKLRNMWLCPYYMSNEMKVRKLKMQNELLTMPEAAKYLRTSEDKAYGLLIHNPDINYVDYDGRKLIPRKQLLNWVRTHMDAANPNKDL